MKKQVIEGTWQKSRAFSPAIITSGGKTVWLAGHGAPVDNTGASLAGDFEAQVHQSFKNIENTLGPVGGKLSDIVSMIVYIIDARYGDQFVELRKQYFPDGFPASALITVAGFAKPDMMVEICPIAVLEDV